MQISAQLAMSTEHNKLLSTLLSKNFLAWLYILKKKKAKKVKTDELILCPLK